MVCRKCQHNTGNYFQDSCKRCVHNPEAATENNFKSFKSIFIREFTHANIAMKPWFVNVMERFNRNNREVFNIKKGLNRAGR